MTAQGRVLALAGPAAGSVAAVAAYALWRRSRGENRPPLRRSMTIGRSADAVTRLWEDSDARSEVAGELGDEAALEFRPGPGEWGTEVVLTLTTGKGKVQRMRADKALRRLKSLAETGEVPTTERNPAAR